MDRATFAIMKAKTNVRRIALFSYFIAMLLVFPGCLTRAVWQDLGTQEWQVEVVSQREIPRHMQVAIDREECSMVLLDGGGPGIADLRLYPAIHGHVACELLLRPEWFEVDSIAFAGSLSHMNGEVKRNDGWLQIRGKIQQSAVSQVIAAGEVPQAVLPDLQKKWRWQQVPLGLQRCGSWLQQGGGKRLLPPGLGQVASLVFVDKDGAVVRRGGGQQRGANYPECRPVLEGTKIYARFVAGDRTTYVQVDAHAFYVLYGIEADRKDPTLDAYRKQWVLREVAPPAVVPADQVTMDTEIWRGEVRSAATSPGMRVVQVVLTPLAIAADAVYTPLVVAVAICVL